jgi:O-antigen/teichoic acid export membrane protein
LGIAYFLSALYLRKQTHPILIQSREKIDREIIPKKIAWKFFNYGAPLSLWFVFSFIIPYIDKIWMKHHLGGEAQGNYQAIFDLLSKGLTLIISPITISLLPLLTQAFTNEEHSQIRDLMKRIILLEIGGFIICAILYWWFGYYLIFSLLKIPDTLTYKYMGLIVLAGTFIWQIAIVIQQKYVLKLMTRFLLIMVIFAVLFQSIFYWIFSNNISPLIYSLGYLFASTLYLILVSFPFMKNKFLFAFGKGKLSKDIFSKESNSKLNS